MMHYNWNVIFYILLSISVNHKEDVDLCVGWKAAGVFSWLEYLSYCNAEAAPVNVFTAVSGTFPVTPACYKFVFVFNDLHINNIS